jgi:hypothetical protein
MKEKLKKAGYIVSNGIGSVIVARENNLQQTF